MPRFSYMKHFIFFLMFVGPLVALGQANDSKAVKETFSNYKKAILDSDGEEAAKWVDSKTVAYYDQMLKASLDADSADVAVLGVIDKLTIFSVRHRIPRQEIAQLNGRQFLIYSIDRGMVGKNTVGNVEIGDVNVDGNSASGQLISQGRKSPLYFQFNKEEGAWKLDLTSLLPATNTGLRKMIADQGMTENEFIFQALEMMNGKPVTADIWSPMK